MIAMDDKNASPEGSEALNGVSLESDSQKQPYQNGPTNWMENKSNMLDEVSQLVDMMSSEKVTLTNQLTVLKSELESSKGQIETLEGEKHQLEEEKRLARLKLKELKQKQKRETFSVRVALDTTKKQLEETRNKLGMLSTNMEEKQNDNGKLRDTNCALDAKVKTLGTKHAGLLSSLGRKTAENAKLTFQLSEVREHHKVLQADNTELQTNLASSQQRYKHTLEEVRALRGRLTITRKSNEQFEIKCIAFEKMVETLNSRSPTVVKVTTRSREEVRLAEECKRKDELLASCLKDASICQSRNQTLERELNKLHSKLNEEKRERLLLQTALETKEREWENGCLALEEKMAEITTDLENKERQESDLVHLRHEMECKVLRIDHELKFTRQELDLLRKEVIKKEEMWDTEKVRLEQEREQLKEQLEVSQETVSSLRHELETSGEEHQVTLDTMTKRWERQLKEAKEDYRRMKEASAKRCTELAKEVWKLKIPT